MPFLCVCLCAHMFSRNVCSTVQEREKKNIIICVDSLVWFSALLLEQLRFTWSSHLATGGEWVILNAVRPPASGRSYSCCVWCKHHRLRSPHTCFLISLSLDLTLTCTNSCTSATATMKLGLWNEWFDANTYQQYRPQPWLRSSEPGAQGWASGPPKWQPGPQRPQ